MTNRIVNGITIIPFLIICKISICTIDINLSELQYLADHLHPEECRRLVAALHFTSYNQPNALDDAERKVPEDIPCLRLLLHWNSAKGEGRSETHELVFRRLRQIGRHDLADWLGRTVFEQIGQDLYKDLNDPFKEVLLETSTSDSNMNLPTLQPEINSDGINDWLPIDTVCWVLILLLSLATFIAIGYAIYLQCKRQYRKKFEQKKKYTQYTKVQHQVTSESESEDQFDIRHSDSALKLMGM